MSNGLEIQKINAGKTQSERMRLETWPILSHLNQQVATMMRIATEFGFTPASRSRIFSFDQKNSLLLENMNRSDDNGLPW